MLLANAIAIAKINKSHPLNLAIKEVLNPAIKQTPNANSRNVDVHAMNGRIEDGTRGFNVCV